MESMESLSYACCKLSGLFTTLVCTHPPRNFERWDAWQRALPPRSQPPFDRPFKPSLRAPNSRKASAFAI